jgi:IMP dehydrogenase
MTRDTLVTAKGTVTLEQAEKILTAQKKVEKLLLVDDSYRLDRDDHHSATST